MSVPLSLHPDNTDLDALRCEIRSSLRLEPVREDGEIPRDYQYEFRGIDRENPDLTESGRVIVSLCTTRSEYLELETDDPDA